MSHQASNVEYNLLTTDQSHFIDSKRTLSWTTWAWVQCVSLLSLFCLWNSNENRKNTTEFIENRPKIDHLCSSMAECVERPSIEVRNGSLEYEYVHHCGSRSILLAAETWLSHSLWATINGGRANAALHQIQFWRLHKWIFRLLWKRIQLSNISDQCKCGQMATKTDGGATMVWVSLSLKLMWNIYILFPCFSHEDGMSRPHNPTDCAAYVEDLIMPHINITAEMSKREIGHFVSMCRMFSERTTDTEIISNETNTKRSLMQNAIRNSNLIDLIEQEMRCSRVVQISKMRKQPETEIMSILTRYVHEFDPSLKLYPFGSSRFGVQLANTNFNLLISTGKRILRNI